MNNDIKIFGEQKHSLNLNNTGTLNEQNLQFAKKTMLFDLLRNHANELIKHKQGYPQNDISEVELKADFVIVNAKQYAKIIKLLNELPQYKLKSIKHLDFPKLIP